ncbi:MAG TPA: nodulation protein NfeD [Bacteroidales bacterium]|nr:nodulation protein NfeD [Bacteroidales bacterium]
MKRILILLCLIITALLTHANIYGNNQAKTTFFSIDLKKNVGSTTWLYIQKGFEEAKTLNANTIIIEMNTYGGEVGFADSIRTKILNSDIPVIVFIDNNAASAGALISIACKKIYMRKGATIGAASVVDQTGQKLPDKYQSYMRATMRATAEAHGKDTIIMGNDTIYKWKRDPLIAEAMVDERTVVENVTDSGKVLTFTTEEAIKHNYCDGMAENIKEVIKSEIGNAEYELVKFKPTTWDDIKGFLLSPIFQSILIMLIIGGIYFELQTPGIGFPLVVAITAALLYFAPLYIDGLAEHWEILLFIIGIILIVLEIFAFPGFGVAGISGIVLVVAGLVLSLIGNIKFNFQPVSGDDFTRATLTVIGGMLFGFGATIYLSNKIGTKGIFKRLALDTTLDNKEGYLGVPLETQNVVGESGIASTVLRPSGKVRIGNKVYDAVSINGAFIEKGTEIKIVKYEAGQVYVEKK